MGKALKSRPIKTQRKTNFLKPHNEWRIWNMKNRIICLVLLLVMALSWCNVIAEDTTQEEKTALAMLNHLAVLSQETNDSKNSRLFMEQAYSELINNTYPNSVDSRTLSRLTRLTDTMEKYRITHSRPADSQGNMRKYLHLHSSQGIQLRQK